VRPIPQRPVETSSAPEPPLPLDDPLLRTPDLDLDRLITHWARLAARRPMTAEQMRGADSRAQRMGMPGSLLMENAGLACAAAARALLVQADRLDAGPVLVLVGPGNNGGDGSVLARYLAGWGHRTAAVLCAAEPEPATRDARENWGRLETLQGADQLHAANSRDVAMLAQGVARASLVVDALLGTGVSGLLREPIRSAVELTHRARREGVPVLAIDCPTALDLTSGQPSDPVVRADVTVTFHRPKQGLLTRMGAALAGRVLVAPIGIPAAADPDAR
jgi:ADP-dependent NAD(P)H-hydrate dehydratase / NAD(P)H-hydrate epimerase